MPAMHDNINHRLLIFIINTQLYNNKKYSLSFEFFIKGFQYLGMKVLFIIGIVVVVVIIGGTNAITLVDGVEVEDDLVVLVVVGTVGVGVAFLSVLALMVNP